MATHNSFRGYGQVMLPPRVIKTEEGEYQRASCAIMTLRGKRSIGDSLENIRYDSPALRTSNQVLCDEISNWKVGDMIEVKGTITSREIIRTNICPACGAENRVQGVMSYVHPIFCTKIEGNISQEEGIRLLKYRNEISNNVTVIGMLTQEPQYHITANKTLIAKYQIAVMRRYRIKEDDPNRRADFIWIKSFGKIAETDKKYLKKGTMIYIDGVVQTINYDRKIICASCNEEFNASETSLEIVPYTVEYLRDYLPQEDNGGKDPEKDQIDYIVGDSKIQQKAHGILESLSQ